MLSKEKIQSLSCSKIHSSASRNKVFPLLSLACTYFWKQATASSSTASMSPSSPSRTLFLNKSSRNSSSMLTADGWYRRARAFFIDRARFRQPPRPFGPASPQAWNGRKGPGTGHYGLSFLPRSRQTLEFDRFFHASRSRLDPIPLSRPTRRCFFPARPAPLFLGF